MTSFFSVDQYKNEWSASSGFERKNFEKRTQLFWEMAHTNLSNVTDAEKVEMLALAVYDPVCAVRHAALLLAVEQNSFFTIDVWKNVFEPKPEQLEIDIKMEVACMEEAIKLKELYTDRNEFHQELRTSANPTLNAIAPSFVVSKSPALNL